MLRAAASAEECGSCGECVEHATVRMGREEENQEGRG